MHRIELSTVHRRLGFLLVGALAIGMLVGPGSLRAGTLRVEKDGSGDFTIIQDALDVATPGDSILIGPGRFDDFQIQSFDGIGEVATVMAVREGPLTIIGSGRDLTTVGPDSLISFIDDRNTYCLQQALPPKLLTLEGINFEHTERGLGIEGTSSFRSMRVRYCDKFLVLLGPRLIPDLVFEDCEFVDDPSRTGPNRAAGIRALVGSQNPGMLVRNCKFLDTQLAVEGVNCDGCVVEDSLFDGAWIPLHFDAGGNVVVRRVRTYRGGNGILGIRGGAHVDLEDSIFGPGAPTAIVMSGSSSLAARGCHIAGGSILTLETTVGVVQVTDSDLLNAGGPTILNGTTATVQPVLDFTNNYWGTTDSTQIAAWIVDDVSNPAEINFVPFRTESVPIRQPTVGGLKALFGPGGPRQK